MKTPCDYGKCPHGAKGGYDCRNFCGLGVDVACDEEDFDDDCYGMEEDKALLNYIEGRVDMSRHYSPSAPWYAPGMSVSDFI